MDCSPTTYYTPVSALVQAALDKTKAGILAKGAPDPTNVLEALFSGLSSTADEKLTKAATITIPDDRTETKEESLSGSLLKFVDAKNASKANLEEAFCRDIDAFNEAFQVVNIFHFYVLQLNLRLKMLGGQPSVHRFLQVPVLSCMTVALVVEDGN